MDYRSFQHAVAVAEEASFVRAAVRVSLTQSALSRSIMALERELGVALFDRTPSGVRPTAAGQLFVERARRILAETRALEDEIRQGHGGMAGSLGLGVVPAIAATVLPRILAWFVEHCPRLQVAAKVDPIEPLCDQLRREQIEFFIAVEEVVGPAPDIELRPIGTIRAGAIFCRAGHPLAQSPAPDTEAVLSYPLIVASIERSMQQIHRALIGAGPDRPVDFRVVCDNLTVLQQVLLLSDALLITSQGGMRELVEAGSVVELPVPVGGMGPEAVPVVVVTLRGRSLSPAAALFIDKVQASLCSASQSRLRVAP